MSSLEMTSEFLLCVDASIPSRTVQPFILRWRSLAPSIRLILNPNHPSPSKSSAYFCWMLDLSMEFHKWQMSVAWHCPLVSCHRLFFHWVRAATSRSCCAIVSPPPPICCCVMPSRLGSRHPFSPSSPAVVSCRCLVLSRHQKKARRRCEGMTAQHDTMAMRWHDCLTRRRRFNNSN